MAAQAANATTVSQKPSVTPTTTAINQTKSAASTGQSSENLGINASTISHPVKNNATSVSKVGPNPENLGVNATVSIHVSHVNNVTTSTTNNTSATLHNQKAISISDNVGIQAK